MRHVRIFVSSPGDCAQERALLDEAVERINQSEVDLFLRTFAWEKDVVPRIGPPPGGVIDEQTPMCDIYVGIMSGRFGGDDTRGSGTEQEFREALARFGDLGKPWILFYFNEQPPVPHTPKAARDFTRVLDFREELETKGIVGTYAGARGNAKGFFETIELHLRTLLQRPEFQAPAVEQAGLAHRAVVQGASVKPVIPPQYLVWLQRKCAGVDLLGLELKDRSEATLQSIYVPLTTTSSREAMEEQSLTPLNPGRRSYVTGRARERRTLLLNRFANESLYVPGPPGSGKSTFCRWVTLLTCAGQMPVANLVDAPYDYRETWPTAFDGRLPIRVRLRECWRALPARPGSRELSRREFERCFATWVASNNDVLDDAGQVLAHFAAGSAIVVLDGVDEVPLAHGEGQERWFPRALLLSGLANAMTAWTAAGNRALVTSRPYGLTAADVRALGLPEAPLLDLETPLQWLLANRWFQQLRPGQEGTRSADLLAAQLQEHSWLQALSVNPLLLTGLCIVLHEGGRLPQDKHGLYVRMVDAVLNSRYLGDVERDRARYRLQTIAYAMHTGQGLGEARQTPEAEVSYYGLDRILREYFDKSTSKEEGNATAVAVREELLSQSGLFLGRGDKTAGFYHLSFQEFLAAQHLDDVEHDLLPVFLERAEVEEWHNTLSLLFASLTREKAARLVTRMVEAFGTQRPRVQQVVADCLDILLARGLRLDTVTEQTCRDAFLVTMMSEAPAAIRCRIGSTLGRLGDPRFHDERLWCLPKDPMLGFVKVPAGSFFMGSSMTSSPEFDRLERPFHEVSLPEYLVARYPVTVAQFAAFVSDTKCTLLFPDCLREVPNHPVASVTWAEAWAYCDWLDASLRASSDIPELLRSILKKLRVVLPSEAEWERAARGKEGRRYPWDAGRDPWNAPPVVLPSEFSPVGTYSHLSTPFNERVDDLCGSIGQWTRSQWRPYPYKWDDGREDREASIHVARVVRGGRFEGAVSACVFPHASYRRPLMPNTPERNVGFRVALGMSSF
jgi:formylglycine-generating enzyme required for sulfatase activity